MIAFDVVLHHLDGVRPVSPTAAFARCPVHQERTGSLSIRAVSDGIGVAVHCFGCGAGTTAVLDALGLTTPGLNGVAPSARVSAPLPAAFTPAWWRIVHQDALALAVRAPWRRPEARLGSAAADLHRALLGRIERLHAAAERLGPELDAAWDLLARANDLEQERRLLELAL